MLQFDQYGALVTAQMPKKSSPSVVTDRRLCAVIANEVKQSRSYSYL